MKRSFRTTVLAVATSGLTVVGSSACSPEDVVDAVSADDSDWRGEDALMGQLEYLAPGEFVIDGQAFFVSEETRYVGGLNVCPAEDGLDDVGFGLVECDLESFEAAARGDVPVHVKAEAELGDDDELVAVSVTEYDSATPYDSGATGAPEAAPGEGTGGGTDVRVAGELEYVSPGEYSVNGTAFHVAEDTVIHAGIYACADGVQDPDTGVVACDFDEFDATLSNGATVLAEVEVVDGIATSITEYEVEMY
ncbi:hypothetical protein ABZ635_12970 [Nocardiopsis sp. NPDC007018]|uniref:hypothetical protein n=1 Tax=Nocardiopsis sp. NPDC007018 TaxID=3155721 RepID=UPI00341076E0